MSFDLADLRGYHYHNGVVFAAYFPGFPSAIARGGHYDGVGKEFGRARPATSFRWTCAKSRGSPSAASRPAPFWRPIAPALRRRIEPWPPVSPPCAGRGEIVVEQLPGTSGCEGPWCDRRLVESDGHWITQAIIKD